MPVYRLDTLQPVIADSAFVFESATVIGEVVLHAHSSIWPGAILRGDTAPITVGEESNVQDGSVLHADPGYPMTVGRGVSVGHQATLHGCTVGDSCLIGIQAVVLNGAVIGADCLIGAGALIPEGRVIPPRSLVIGIGKIVRTLEDHEVANLRANAQRYVERARLYREQLVRVCHDTAAQTHLR